MNDLKDFVIENDILKKYVGSDEDVVIPEGVIAIGPEAFANSPSLKSVIISEGVQEIFRQAFFFCKQLKKVHIPSTVTIIHYKSFMGCDNLEEVVFPEKLKLIDSCAFYGCKSLKNISIPQKAEMGNSVKNHYCGQFANSGLEEATFHLGIEPSCGYTIDSIFSSCKFLRKVTIKNDASVDFSKRKFALSLKKSFNGCPLEVVYATECDISLLGELKPYAVVGYIDSVENKIPIDPAIAAGYEKYIRRQKRNLFPLALKNENLLRYMTERGIIEAGDIEKLLDIADKSKNAELKALLLEYRNKRFSIQDIEKAQLKEEKRQLRLPTDTELLKKLWSTRKLADGTLVISKYKGKDNIVEIPEQIGKAKVTAIGQGAFEKNAVITEVIIPPSITMIGRSAFSQCKNLEKVTLSDGLLSLDYFVFHRCKSLREIVVPNSVTSLGYGVFFGMHSLGNACSAARTSENPW